MPARARARQALWRADEMAMSCVQLEGLGPDAALIVVDVQNDFADARGSLYVPGGEQIVPAINELVGCADRAGMLVVYT